MPFRESFPEEMARSLHPPRSGHETNGWGITGCSLQVKVLESNAWLLPEIWGKAAILRFHFPFGMITVPI